MQSGRFATKKLAMAVWILAFMGCDAALVFGGRTLDCEKAILVGGFPCGAPELSQAGQGTAELYAAVTGGSKAAVERSAPTLEELRNATYKGLANIGDKVTLVNGRWEGPPMAANSAIRPMVELLEPLRVTGDMNGDGVEESAVFLNLSTGGTGQLLHIAVAGRRGGRVENLATRLIGDRIQIRDLRIQNRKLHIDVVRAGVGDALCCPGEIATEVWTLDGNAALRPVVSKKKPGRFTPDSIGRGEWTLKSWDVGEQVPMGARVTLAYQDGRFIGTGGCNRYFAPVKVGDAPGSIVVGPIGATRKSCPAAESGIEATFLERLAQVKKYGFWLTHLALTYETGGVWKTMLFNRLG
jgi:heat shock protein HslJ